MKKRNWLPLLVAVVSTLIYVSCSKDSTTTYVGNWSQMTPLGGVARTGAFSFVIGDFGYVGGGYGVSADGRANTRLNDVWSYDSQSDLWSQVTSLDTVIVSGIKTPVTARTGAVGFSIDGIGYIGTGYDGVNYLKDFYAYDPAARTWTKKADFGGIGRNGAIGFGINHKGYIGTGFGGNNMNDFYVYNPGQDEWTLLGNVGEKRKNGAAFVIDTKVYICTGLSVDGASGNGLADDLLIFDSETGVWTKGRKIFNSNPSTFDDDYTDIQRCNAVAFSAKGVGYITLGTLNGGSLSTSTKTWEYDPKMDLWTRKTSFEGVARADAVSFSIGNRVFVGSGGSPADTYGKSQNQYDDFWEFKPSETYDQLN